VEHEGVHESLDDRALGFSEPEDLVFARGVGEEYLTFGGLEGYVVFKN
jgi:hypothetical protein